jgi:hypothetical protein
MLSNCKDCDFFNHRGCAVKPEYWHAFDQIQEAPKKEKEIFSKLLEPCPDWKESSEVQMIEAKICISIRAWKKLAADREELDPDYLPLQLKAKEIIGKMPKTL